MSVSGVCMEAVVQGVAIFVLEVEIVLPMLAATTAMEAMVIKPWPILPMKDVGGIGVMYYAAEGFERARYLVISRKRYIASRLVFRGSN